ncbi:MAG: RDD family protein [Thermoplasmata archaeon]
MLDPWQLGFDAMGTILAFALTPLLWLFLALFAWEQGPFAESVGFGKLTFWLLVPASLLAYVAELTFTRIGPDLLAINLGGGLFPLLVSCALFTRIAPPLRRSLAFFGIWFSVESALALFAVVYLPNAATQDIAVTAIAVAFSFVAFFVAPRLLGDSPAFAGRRVAGLVALTSGVTVLTFLASYTVPGAGIEEQFPIYLITPVLAGFVAVLIARPLFAGREALALPMAYCATTFGVLVGADVLRQPPLYGAGPMNLYVIGGADILDLLYLSGLLALAAAYAAHRLLERGWSPVPDDATPTPPAAPTHRLARSLQSQYEGASIDAVRTASAAAHDAAAQAHRILELPEAPDPARPWSGLGVPGWVVADQANLDALAATSPAEPAEGMRAWLAARMLVGVGRSLWTPRLASVRARIAAYAIDLALVTAPAIAVWWFLAASIGGSLVDVLSAVSFVAAAYGYIAVAFLYGAISESAFGTTPGKWLLGLEVRDRNFRRPGWLAAFVRAAPRLATFSAIGLGLSAAVAILAHGGVGAANAIVFGNLSNLVALLYFLAIALTATLLFGAFAILVMVLTSERQRVGDRWAGTWVIRAARSISGAPSASPSPMPSGPPRS